MAGDAETDSPLRVDAGTAGTRVAEAFSILGNELRLSILLALWEAYEPDALDNTLLFSELRERLGNPDSGQFNYHLDKLNDHFIRKTDDGYELRGAGHQLVRTIIAGTGIEDPTLEPTETDRECALCGAPTAVTYHEGELYLVCTDCEGYWERTTSDLGGVIAVGDFAPAGLTNRTPVEAWGAMSTAFRSRVLSVAEGVCPFCSGAMEISLNNCEEHASDGLCDECGREWALSVSGQCHVCKYHEAGPPYWFLSVHPEVIGFYNARGVPLQYEFNDYRGMQRAEGEFEQELMSNDPLEVQITYEYEGDRLEVLVDEDMDVIDINHPK